MQEQQRQDSFKKLSSIVDIMEQETQISNLIWTKKRALESELRPLSALFFDGRGDFEKTREAGEFFESKILILKEQLHMIGSIVPEGKHFTYHHIYQKCLTDLISVALLSHWITNDYELLKYEDLAKKFDVVPFVCKFSLDLEDYLFGVIKLCSMFERMAVALGTNRKISELRIISKFLRAVHDGFRLLSLKNGMLRRKFDGLKYVVTNVDQILIQCSSTTKDTTNE